ncbi:MAG: class I SAM-dependent methyltransferase [Acidimicrobiales bacterium]
MDAQPDVATANVDQQQLWNGPTGDHWAVQADRFERMVAPFHQALMEATPVAADAYILDVGCGTGQTTRALAGRAADGRALGVDISRPMLSVAAARAERAGVANVEFRLADAQVAPLGRAAFDTAVSQFGGMFFADPVAAYANLHRAVRPGGSLGLLVWRAVQENQWMMELIRSLAGPRPLPKRAPGTPGPFAFAEPDRITRTLDDAGWRDVTLTPLDAETVVGGDAAEALDMGLGLGEWLLDGADDGERATAVDRLRSRYRELVGPGGVVVAGAAWLVTAQA